jgi:hypothetical protein
MKQNEPSKIDQLLDLLLDALQERQAARGGERPGTPPPPVAERPIYEAPEPAVAPVSAAYHDEPDEPEPETAEEDLIPSPYIPEKLPTIHLDRMLGRLALFILAITVIMNIPFNRFGTNLARAMPDDQALVIRDGLVLKGSGEEIYVLEDNHKRWISSLDAFEHYGYRWQQVNVVNDAFLDQFPNGPALSILKKCATSPHVYAIENGVKRWIKDIPTFEAQGYVWEDVQIVSCTELENTPTGSPIPPDAGKPPAP